MRRLAVPAAISLVLGACTGAVETSTTAPPPLPTVPPAATTTSTTTTSPTAATAHPTTTTAPEQWEIRLILDRAEADGLSRQASIAVGWDGGPDPATAPTLRIADLVEVITGGGTPPDELQFAYLTVDGGITERRWSQPVDPGPFTRVAQPWRGIRPPPGHGILMAWQAAGDTPRYVRQLDAAPGLVATSPVWWFLDADGAMTSSADAGLVVAAHERDIEIWPAIASLDADRIHAAMADPQALAFEVSAAADAIGADGVNVDLEGYRQEDAPAVAEFVEVLADAVHAWGGVVSIDLVPRSDRWEVTPRELEFWSSAPDRRRLAAAVDYAVLMAYDQHNRYRPAGPVASPAWVEETLRYLLRYVDADRVILGVPFYGRVWDPDDLFAPRAIGAGAIAELAATGERSYDSRFGVDRVDLDDGRYLWVETAAELAHRVELADRYGLAGLAGWRLGLDDPAVWEVLAGRP